MVSRRQLAALIVGVCILSAAIGSGITLLAERGPVGPPGPEGPEGPPGPAAEVALLEAEEALDRANSVAGRLGEFEAEVAYLVEEEARNLSGDVAKVEAAASTICQALETYC